MRASIAFLSLSFGLAIFAPASAQTDDDPASDPRDFLLAALGKATLDCLHTVGPSMYSTASGKLERAFDACTPDAPGALEQIDALLGVQDSVQGREDGIAEHYVSRWNAFTDAFPRFLTECPTWSLEAVIDAPTDESVARMMRLGRPGKESYRYAVTSPRCGSNGRCAVRLASACAGGFGPDFIAEVDRTRARVEVDPTWWLLNDPAERDDECNPFRRGGYAHGVCDGRGTDPFELYGAIERAGEACCVWSEADQQIYTNAMFVPIDCGGGWLCLTYCKLQ